MAKLDPNNPQHVMIRDTLRVVGPVVLGIGIIFLAVGLLSVVSSMGSFDQPRYFWCFFIGIPIAGIGGMLCQVGYVGAVARYMAREGAPVASDTFNYAASETREGIKQVAGAIAEGIRDSQPKGRFCTQCGAANDLDARFCKACGHKLS